MAISSRWRASRPTTALRIEAFNAAILFGRPIRGSSSMIARRSCGFSAWAASVARTMMFGREARGVARSAVRS
jgi:hypothetical protein